MSNSRRNLVTKADPEPEQPKNTSRSGKVAHNVYKPGFIDTATTEDMKMSVDRELGELSKALFKTGENIETWQDETGGSLAKITEEINVLTENDKALAEKIVTLTATVDGNTASITETNRVVADLDSSVTERITTLRGEVTAGDNQLQGIIQDEASIRLEKDNALGTRISNMEVSFDGKLANTDAAIKNEEQVRANADEALAKRTSVLEASLSGDLTNIFLNGYFEGGEQHGLDGYGIVRGPDYTGGPPNPPHPNRLEISVRENLGKKIPVALDDIYSVNLQCAAGSADAPVLRMGFKTFNSTGTELGFVEVESRNASSDWKKIFGSYKVVAGVTHIQFCLILDYNNTNKYWHITNVSWTNITEQGGVYAAIKTEELARVTADEALAKVTERIESEYKAADRDINTALGDAQKEIVEAKAAITAESETRANADEALAKTSERLEADYKKADGDLQNGINGANAGVTEAKAAIQRESEIRASADDSLAQTTQRIESEYKTADGNTLTAAKGYVDEKVVILNNADQSIIEETKRIEAAYIKGDKDTLSSSKAYVDQEVIVLAEADRAQVDALTQYKAEVGGKFATVDQYASATADRVGNVEGKWGVTIDANGAVAGVQLNNGSGGSEFIVAANKFKFRDTSGSISGGFTSSNGVTVFNGDIHANNGYFRGTIYAENMVGDVYEKKMFNIATGPARDIYFSHASYPRVFAFPAALCRARAFSQSVGGSSRASGDFRIYKNGQLVHEQRLSVDQSTPGETTQSTQAGVIYIGANESGTFALRVENISVYGSSANYVTLVAGDYPFEIFKQGSSLS